MPPGDDTLAVVFQFAQGNSPLMAQASFAQAKAVFEKVRTATARRATPSHKRIVGALTISQTPETRAGSEGIAGVGLPVQKQNQLTYLVGPSIANLIPPQGVLGFHLQSYVSQPNPPFILCTQPALVDSSSRSIPVQIRQGRNFLQHSSFHSNSTFSTMLLSSSAHDFCRNLSKTTTWTITKVQIEQGSAVLPGVASSAGMLARP